MVRIERMESPHVVVRSNKPPNDARTLKGMGSNHLTAPHRGVRMQASFVSDERAPKHGAELAKLQRRYATPVQVTILVLFT
jgi:hypothetical protein